MHKIFSKTVDFCEKSWGGVLKKSISITVALIVFPILSFADDYSGFGATKMDVAKCKANDSSAISDDYNWGISDNWVMDYKKDSHAHVKARVNLVSIGDIEKNGDTVIGMKFCPLQIFGVSAAKGIYDNLSANRNHIYLIYNHQDSSQCIWLYTGDNGKNKTGKRTMPTVSAVPTLSNNLGTISTYRANFNNKYGLGFGSYIAEKECKRSGEENAANRSTEHANMFVVEKSVPGGAYVRLYTASGYVIDNQEFKNRTSSPYLSPNGNGVSTLVCLPGYSVNENGDGCIPYCGNKPSVCNYTSGSTTTWGTWNTKYQYTTTKCECKCDDTSCRYNVSVSARCAAGYYGSVALTYNGSSLSVTSGACNVCPSAQSPYTGKTPTSAAGARYSSECYITVSNTMEDDTGYFQVVDTGGKCYYK